jgi:hypothetical protein
MVLPSRRLVCFAVLSFAAQCIGLASPVAACDTPVYRYAMYRWEPTPYELYYFHREAPGEADKQVQELVERIGRRDEKSRANLVYLPVNLSEDEQLVGVPADVKQGWLARENPTVPSYMLVTPLGQQVYFGAFDVAEIEKLVASPVRTKFAELLGDGHTGVMLLVDGKDQKANEAALEMLRTLAADVEVGKVKLYAGAADMFPPGVVPPGRDPAAAAAAAENPDDDKKDAGKAEEPKQRVGLIRIARDDPQEQWLLRQLEAAEPDLKKFADQPMVFVAYGRGRALPPYIGAGITRENLLDCLYFISGACSCTVKEQNPGVDLLVRYDWDAAAQKMAEQFAGEEGADRFGVDNLFPELIFSPPKPKQPESDATSSAAETETKVESPAEAPGESEDVDASAGSTTTAKPAAATPSEEPTEDGAGKNDEPVENIGADDAVKHASPSPQAAPADAAFSPKDEQDVAHVTPQNRTASTEREPGKSAERASSSVWYTVGIGMGVALLVLIGATMLFYRPK